MVISIITAVFASTGFWTLITYLVQKKHEKDSNQVKMIKGLGHDRICHLGSSYIKRGYITKDEYENLYDYLYTPYKDLGGNGAVEKIIGEVKKLPFKNE